MIRKIIATKQRERERERKAERAVRRDPIFRSVSFQKVQATK